ncbi:phytoene/squalene synthase family protein [Candidatus Pelagibacter sp.]|uniref:phytoene/squalene synthase family protein n=1 Tax=Candidatus Pelagibacter sp. TaxID=2024849 RepID=UPI003F853FD3
MSKNYLSIYAKSFNWAGFFLPKETYANCSKLYDFCRTADNIADEQNSLDFKKKNFEEFKEAFNKKDRNNSIIKNIWELIEKFNISTKIIDDLFDGIDSDIREKVKLNSKKELLIYSYRVAGTVGLMMAKILKVNDKESLRSAIDLGIAMQLTNISRDVIEDEKNNRVYISADLETIKSTILFAEKFYENSFYAMKKIPLSLRFSIIVARRIYRKIGLKIIKIKSFEDYKNSGKIYVNKFEKILETILSIFDLIKLTVPNNNIRVNHNHELIEEEIKINERV